MPDDHVDEGSGSASEPEGTGGSAAAEGADARRAHAQRAPGTTRGRGHAGAALRRELVLRRSASLFIIYFSLPLCTPPPL